MDKTRRTGFHGTIHYSILITMSQTLCIISHMNEMSSSNSIRFTQVTIKRPFPITLMALLIICLGASGLYRFGWYILNWEFVWSLTRPFSLWYIVNSSLLLGLSSLLVGFLVWSGKPIVRKMYIIWLVLFSFLFWIEKLWISTNPTARIDWPFALVMNLLIASSTLGILFSPQTDDFFMKEKK